jgi:hypothetical protein
VNARTIARAASIAAVAFALLGYLDIDPTAWLLAWFTAIAACVASTSIPAGGVTGDALVMPVAYRFTAAVVVCVAIGAALLTRLPDANAVASLQVPYELIVALLGYRALVADKPDRALATAWVALVGWIPSTIMAFMGCHKGRPPGSEDLVGLALVTLAVMSAVLQLVSLHAWQRVPAGISTARVSKS